jgi:hypothetical protein
LGARRRSGRFLEASEAWAPTVVVELDKDRLGEGYAHIMEPTLATDPELLGILDELAQREPIFHRPELGTTRADFENMTAADFWEIGASGRRYARAYVLDELEKRYASQHADAWQTSDLHCRRLADAVYLLTYTLVQQGQRRTRRATIWQQTPQGWKIIFHQGTIVQDF